MYLKYLTKYRLLTFSKMGKLIQPVTCFGVARKESHSSWLKQQKIVQFSRARAQRKPLGKSNFRRGQKILLWFPANYNIVGIYHSVGDFYLTKTSFIAQYWSQITGIKQEDNKVESSPVIHHTLYDQAAFKYNIKLTANLSPLFFLYSLSFYKIYLLEFTFHFFDLKDKELCWISLINEHLAF